MPAVSEFSDSYYLRAPADVARRLVTRVNAFGVVLPSDGPWTPFLLDEPRGAGDLLPEALAHNPGVLLIYYFAEDHGLGLSAYEGQEKRLQITGAADGPSENDIARTLSAVGELNIVRDDRVADLEALLAELALDERRDPGACRDRLGKAFGVGFLPWTSCAQLSRSSKRDLRQRFPTGLFVLERLRGKPPKMEHPEPNEWCPEPEMPPFMYWPVPDGPVDEAILTRHVRHWIETRDFDEARQAGFWLYNGYKRALPARFGFLADRIMNLSLAFPAERYDEELRRTLRGILAVVPKDFEWEPYLGRRAGETRL
jgi:hypothetical protein